MIRKLLSTAVCSWAMAANAQTTLPAYVPTNNLRAYYGLNGNANDLSGNGNHGNAYNLAPAADRSGNAGGAYAFNGFSSYIKINPSATLDLNGSNSISAWVKVDPTVVQSSYQQIFWRGDLASGMDPYSLCINQGKYCYRRDGYVIDAITTPLLDANFHHLVATYNDTLQVYKIYLDGNLVSVKSAGTAIYYSTSSFWNIIGAVDNGSGQNFNGVIDDLAVYGRAIGECEVQQLYLQQANFIIAQQPVDAYAAVNGAVTFTTQSATPNTVYQWQISTDGGMSFFDLNAISNYRGVDTNVLKINPVNANNYGEFYRCKLSFNSNCTQYTQKVRILTPTSVSNLGLKDEVEVFPNPATDKIVVRFKDNPVGKVSVSVFNAVGQIVYAVITSDKEITIPRVALGAAGVYQVRIVGASSNAITHRILAR